MLGPDDTAQQQPRTCDAGRPPRLHRSPSSTAATTSRDQPRRPLPAAGQHPLGLAFGVGQDRPCPLLAARATLGEELGRRSARPPPPHPPAGGCARAQPQPRSQPPRTALRRRPSRPAARSRPTVRTGTPPPRTAPSPAVGTGTPAAAPGGSRRRRSRSSSSPSTGMTAEATAPGRRRLGVACPRGRRPRR